MVADLRGTTFPFLSAMTALAAVGVLAGVRVAHAQELEPRSYSASPIGTNFLLLSFSNSNGDVEVDPSLPLTNVSASINTLKIGFSRTFDLGGHMASLAILLPYIQGDAHGQVYTQSREISRSGLANVGARLAINLIGCPALSPAQFARRKPTTTVGASLTFVAPTGTYNPTYLINTGTNRWAFRPEIGVEQPINNFFVDASAGLWLFTNNPDFFGGKTLGQSPLSDLQMHAGYNFHPGLWLSADGNYYSGGETTINGVPSNNSLANSRYGLTFSDPVGQGFSAKLAWSHWLTGNFGSKYDTLGLTLQYRWFDR